MRAWLNVTVEFLVAGTHWKTKVLVVILHHPLADMTQLFPPASHESNLNFRLTVPLLVSAFSWDPAGWVALDVCCDRNPSSLFGFGGSVRCQR